LAIIFGGAAAAFLFFCLTFLLKWFLAGIGRLTGNVRLERFALKEAVVETSTCTACNGTGNLDDYDPAQYPPTNGT